MFGAIPVLCCAVLTLVVAQLWFQVRDTGIGIPEANFPDLFATYSQVLGSFDCNQQQRLDSLSGKWRVEELLLESPCIGQPGMHTRQHRPPLDFPVEHELLRVTVPQGVEGRMLWMPMWHAVCT